MSLSCWSKSTRSTRCAVAALTRVSASTRVDTTSARQVVVLDKMDYCSSLRNLDAVKDCPNFKFIKGNILSTDLVAYVLATEKIDTIIHAAAQTHVDNSFGNSFTFTENNVLGTHVLLESAKASASSHRIIAALGKGHASYALLAPAAVARRCAPAA